MNKSSKLFLLILMIMTISCQKEKLNFIEFPMENLPIKISINDTTNLRIELYENGYIKSITTKNKEGIKNGPHLEYFPNGILKERYTWVKNEISGKYEIFNDLGDKLICYTYVDGKKNGDMFEFSHDSLIKSHFLFKDGKAIYLGAYGDGRKGLSSPLPVFKNERIRNDSTYEAEITFPFSFKGDMDILLLDTIEYEKEFADKYNINLTITNFDKSWKVYELLLDYSPAEDDSLAATEQIYKHTIDVE